MPLAGINNLAYLWGCVRDQQAFLGKPWIIILLNTFLHDKQASLLVRCIPHACDNLPSLFWRCHWLASLLRYPLQYHTLRMFSYCHDKQGRLLVRCIVNHAWDKLPSLFWRCHWLASLLRYPLQYHTIRMFSYCHDKQDSLFVRCIITHACDKLPSLFQRCQ